jgi:hypothetical protein
MRGCEEESDEIFHEWAPDLRRCPKTLLTHDVSMWLRHWEEWRELGVLPYGTRCLGTEPAFVSEIFLLCNNTYNLAMKETPHDA